MIRSVLLAAVLVPLAAAPARAAADAPGGADDPHTHTPADIVVTGAIERNRQDVLSGVAVLQGAELDHALRSSLGETLDGTPGVSATSFGPTASRPVLRGLQGERVRVLSDGIGSIDVSNTSVDHAVVINPLLAERIEVLRGPQALLYGSSAVGGVVNVIDKRIPTAVPEHLHVGAIGTYGSAADERSVAGTVDVPVGGGFVAHADASWSESRDMRIGGYALTPALRAEALATALSPEADPEIDYLANAAVSGRLPNTAARTWTAGAGASYVNDRGMLGIAFTHTDSRYGIPLRLATAPGQEQEAPRIQLQQDRVDGRAQINAGGSLIDRVVLRFGFADYRHAEIEPDGTVGTTFLNKGLEARLELAQARRGVWQGASGVQYTSRDFDVAGAEAFLPRYAARQTGLFTLQQLELGAVKVEAGARFEHSDLTASPDAAQPQFFAGKRSFDTLSGSMGASWRFAPAWTSAVNLSHTARAPAPEELFANGPHAGTEAFEIGDTALRPERATSVEAILRRSGAGFTLEASAYHTWFRGFIHDERTGAIAEGLPVYRIRQAPARFYGFEVQGRVDLAQLGGWTLSADALADFVHATIEGSGPAPRIPPLRMLGGLSAASGSLDLRAEIEHVTAQTRVARNETTTPAYTLVNAEIGWRPWGRDRPLTFALSANNIFDVAARRHASFLKDYAPLAGRDIRLTARLEI